VFADVGHALACLPGDSPAMNDVAEMLQTDYDGILLLNVQSATV
jgi:hypothetical protein